MADALDSKSSEGKPRAGSSPASGIAVQHRSKRKRPATNDVAGLFLSRPS